MTAGKPYIRGVKYETVRKEVKTGREQKEQRKNRVRQTLLWANNIFENHPHAEAKPPRAFKHYARDEKLNRG